MKNRYTLLYFLAVLIIGIAVACSGENNDKKTKGPNGTVIEPGEDMTAREAGFFERTTTHPYTENLRAAYKLISKKYKYVSFFANTYSGSYFLVQNRKDLYTDDYKPDKKVRFGLTDVGGNQLLPVEYEKISNPGFIADDYMEVRKDGKSGLYNYAAKKLITPEYDVIYPSSIMEYVAIGQKGINFFKIYADGKSKPFKEGEPAPNYAWLLKKYELNLEKEHFGLWISTEALDYMNEEDDFFAYSRGMITAPSYIDRLGVLPTLVADLLMPWADVKDSLSVSLSDSRNRSESAYAMLASFFTYSAEARGMESETRYLLTLDRKNTIKSRIKVLEWNSYSIRNACNLATPSARFLNDSIVEVKNYVELTSNPALPYERYSKNDYYSIAADGTVKHLYAGFFPMTSVVELKKSHFTGCFMRPIADDEILNFPDFTEEDIGNEIYGFRMHLTAADLEYMRNEIYARHGLRFKDPRWSSVFKSFKWYKATSANVDAKLTPVEKKNLQLIRQVEKELKENPEKFPNEEARYLEMAG
jgi:hypothetical protein